MGYIGASSLNSFGAPAWLAQTGLPKSSEPGSLEMNLTYKEKLLLGIIVMVILAIILLALSWIYLMNGTGAAFHYGVNPCQQGLSPCS
jgi:hypothetical protein